METGSCVAWLSGESSSGSSPGLTRKGIQSRRAPMRSASEIKQLLALVYFSGFIWPNFGNFLISHLASPMLKMLGKVRFSQTSILLKSKFFYYFKDFSVS